MQDFAECMSSPLPFHTDIFINLKGLEPRLVRDAHRDSGSRAPTGM